MQFHAFDILVSDGEELRKLPLSACARRALARLLARRVDGIYLSHSSIEVRPDLFRHACLMGLEGMASKHRESTYRGGRYDRWIKGQEAEASGVSGVQDQF